MAPAKQIVWIGRALADLREFPAEARRNIGFALRAAQAGGKHSSAKPLKGMGSAATLEIVEDFDGDTFRAVYTVRFAERVYVLHCFQKKSTHGVATPKHELDLIEQRLSQAKEHHQLWKNGPKTK